MYFAEVNTTRPLCGCSQTHDTYDPAIRVISPRILEQSLSADPDSLSIRDLRRDRRTTLRHLGRLGLWAGSGHEGGIDVRPRAGARCRFRASRARAVRAPGAAGQVDWRFQPLRRKEAAQEGQVSPGRGAFGGSIQQAAIQREKAA